MFRNIFRWLFLKKEIMSKQGVLHFQRWRIFSCPWFGIYIHKIYEKDKDLHLHNHPWNYFNIILKGGYEEKSLQYGKEVYQNMLPFSCTKRKHDTYHCINDVFSTTTTLFFTGRAKYAWGYNVNGDFIEHTIYRIVKNKMKKWDELDKLGSELEPRPFEP